MDYLFKFILFGDAGVGKTTLVERYVNGTFKANTQVTIGVQFLYKRLKLNSDVLNLQIWDLGGEDRFRFVFPGYCNKANGGFFVFDVTRPDSLYHIKEWMEIVAERKATFPVVLVGTKTDLTPHRLVKRAEEIKIAKDYNLPDVVEISSKTGRNVDFAFETLSKRIIDMLKQTNSQNTSVLPEIHPPSSVESPKPSQTVKKEKPPKKAKSTGTKPRIWI